MTMQNTNLRMFSTMYAVMNIKGEIQMCKDKIQQNPVIVSLTKTKSIVLHSFNLKNY